MDPGHTVLGVVADDGRAGGGAVGVHGYVETFWEGAFDEIPGLAVLLVGCCADRTAEPPSAVLLRPGPLHPSGSDRASAGVPRPLDNGVRKIVFRDPDGNETASGGGAAA
jgi:hypothetical protein